MATEKADRGGPLSGVRVLEFAGLGPVPYAAMLLSDMGADVVRLDRPGAPRRERDILLRGRRSFALDLKDGNDLACARRLAERAEILLEGFRPGVMERLGLGPDALLASNPALVYGRMTGWGQTGPLAPAAGHDIDYIALSGALGAIGQPDGPPAVPLNLIGDYGGGSTFLVIGVLAALLESRRSGRGQVIDCAIGDNVLSLMTLFHSMLAAGTWNDRRGANQLDGAAHFYTTYECADGKHLAIGAGEPQFYASLRRLAGLSDPDFDRQRDPAAWPVLKEKAQAVFRTRTRDEWVAIFEASDCCVAPVLSIEESLRHPHFTARSSVVEIDGVAQAAPVPRFSRTPPSVGRSAAFASRDELASCWDDER
ncbi:MAG TPA: CaiB/BaiF CoA-transferase family protein [Hyphomicrobiales bacterium]|nr:CaiB/BaiF CoA-transferase family protein [Hyphomicrobiales bacterium]